MAAITTLTSENFDRRLFESVMKRRFFFTEAFEIYRLPPHFKGDNRGLFDYGPPDCAYHANIVDAWRKHLVLEENMLEVDCTVITEVLPNQFSEPSGMWTSWRTECATIRSKATTCELIILSRTSSKHALLGALEATF
ncbi:hypothetical protein N657DRAFT_168593 [Parathielavia appendiculata]|uniref:Uncharacterized protein n=1 Tax=Parathielavia appendiculata TaxID=2587402 RepID=A0AAN6Z086_9PEZI|nr:hypothetical protein N657DRAFT_168593 [Parathielavia appendiculata]